MEEKEIKNKFDFTALIKLSDSNLLKSLETINHKENQVKFN